MHIKLAKTAGFCMGVKKAIQKALKTADSESEIYTCGQLIHNRQAVEALKAKGIQAIENWKDIKTGTVIIRAHGMPKNIISQIREKGIKIEDATCPHVLGSQKKIEKYYNEGYFIIIVGDQKHPEILSLQSFAPDRHCVISKRDDIYKIENQKKCIVIAQTTFNKNEYSEICDEIKSIIQECIVFDSICLATSKRQEEVKNIAENVDAVIVVGGMNSANTKRLAQIASETGKPVFHIETADDLDLNTIGKFDSIGITAGASTPHWITNEVLETLNSLEKEIHPIRYRLYELLRIMINSNIFVALSAAMLSIFTMIVYNYPSILFKSQDFLYFPIITFAFVFSMYNFNNNFRVNTDNREISEMLYLPEKNIFLSKYFFSFSLFSSILIILSLILSFILSYSIFFILILGYIAGFLYDRKFLPRFLTLKTLKNIPVSKDIFISAALTVLCGFLPLLRNSIAISIKHIYMMTFIFFLTFIKNVALDLRDIEGDRIIGRETLPVVINRKNTQIFLAIFSTALLIGTLFFLITKGFPTVSWLLLTGPVYIYIYIILNNKDILRDELYCEIAIDGMYIFLGTAGLIWTYI